MSTTGMNPIIEGTFFIERYPGKGGWSYLELPPIPKPKDVPFGWIEASANLDGLFIEHLKLWPMKTGHVMLSLRAAIRKKINKEAGDSVHLQLFPFDPDMKYLGELTECIRLTSPQLLSIFDHTPEWEVTQWCVRISKAKTLEKKTEIIGAIIDELEDKIL